MTLRLQDHTGDVPADVNAANQNHRMIETALNALTETTTAYTPTNVTPDNAYDANATTTAELADVLGTLIADLQAKGVIS